MCASLEAGIVHVVDCCEKLWVIRGENFAQRVMQAQLTINFSKNFCYCVYFLDNWFKIKDFLRKAIYSSEVWIILLNEQKASLIKVFKLDKTDSSLVIIIWKDHFGLCPPCSSQLVISPSSCLIHNIKVDVKLCFTPR